MNFQVYLYTWTRPANYFLRGLQHPFWRPGYKNYPKLTKNTKVKYTFAILFTRNKQKYYKSAQIWDILRKKRLWLTTQKKSFGGVVSHSYIESVTVSLLSFHCQILLTRLARVHNRAGRQSVAVVNKFSKRAWKTILIYVTFRILSFYKFFDPKKLDECDVLKCDYSA